MQVTLSHVGYAYPGTPQPILTDISVTFPQGWSGLLGDNGCGKTTLAKIACGIIEPDSGSVINGFHSVICPQETDTAPDGLLDFASDYGREARELRTLFGIENDMPWRFELLSHGEKKKLQIAVALWHHPNMLVLDEPTNHIDRKTRVLLIDALRGFHGIGILVSHDRELLDALAERCISFEPGGIVVRPGTYTAAREQREREQHAAVRKRKAAKAELSRIRAEKQTRAQEASRASARLSKRHIDRKDHSSKERINLAKYSGQDGRRGRISSQIDARLEAAQKHVEAAYVEQRYEGDLWFHTEPSSRKVLLRIPAMRIPCGERNLSIPRLFVENTDHIGIVGDNGTGKTTLIQHLRAMAADDIPILDIPQELSRKESRQILARARNLSDFEKGRLLSTIAQLNSDPARILSGNTVSPGELRKLALALGALDGPELVFMDEPTNHLDLHSIEALERALASYPGALVVVSHDPTFLNACTNRIWTLAEGTVCELSELP